ncbi:MAG TPA: HEAT repeat domain-containing protein, partial [Pirellulales bacterium]|nr:HEAT repeat domain-containing protein [Pirellulales bacterium]
VETPVGKFEIVEILKGADQVAGEKVIEVAYFDDKPVGTEFLVEGAQPPVIAWTPPVALTSRSHKYLSDLMKLPADGPQRLLYLMDFLGDKEELLASDSYDEFALAPYSALQGIKDKMPHDLLVKRVLDPEVVPSRRRLYLTMLGVCGNDKDLPVLEKLLKEKDPKFKAGLDATVACYLVLRGEKGLPLIEDLFLKQETDEYTDIYSVVMALRILGQEKNGPIPLPRIVQSMRLVLNHPRVADQAIMDLARWQDWTVIDRLVELFKSNDQDVSSWVRVPVVNYLRACPLPKAKEYLAELRKVDPKAIRQSETLYPDLPSGSGEATAAATNSTPANPPASAPANSPNPAPAGKSQSGSAGGSAAESKAGAASQSVSPNDTSTDSPKLSVQAIASGKSGDTLNTLEARSWYIIVPAAIIGAAILAFVARGPRSRQTTNAK